MVWYDVLLSFCAILLATKTWLNKVSSSGGGTKAVLRINIYGKSCTLAYTDMYR